MRIYGDCSTKLSINRRYNFITIRNKQYQLKYLNDNLATNKGGNSNVFTLYDPQNDTEDFVIKFCKANLLQHNNSARVKRFRREIAALRRAKLARLNKVVNIIFYGKLDLKDYETGKEFKFYYHVTEKALHDLADYIVSDLIGNTTQAKVQLCWELIRSLKQLHTINIYHRDIKPENIIIFNDGTWKFCDLGLVEFRDIDFTMDRPNAMIGPRGWMSPEACNSNYNYCSNMDSNYYCEIDMQSDVFQLGKIFWFVFQKNIPIGRVHRGDFVTEDDRIYSFIIWMLNHDKKRRLSINILEKEFFNTLNRAYVF